MKRREFFRRTLVGGIAAATPVLSAGTSSQSLVPDHGTRKYGPTGDWSKELERSDWKPIFLTDHQDRTLTVLSDLIIPETDTPGAKAALVNRFIDLLMAAEPKEVQQAFLDSLAYIDGASMKRYNRAFIYLPRENQVEFLSFIGYPHSLVTWHETQQTEYPGYAHFRNLKERISEAYYSSEIGMRALGWDGQAIHGPFQGCSHQPDTHN